MKVPKYTTTTLTKAVERLKEDRSNTVAFFTGAGASKAFGYPLTSELLPRMFDWQDKKSFLSLDDDKDQSVGERRRRKLKVLLRRLLPGVHNSSSPLPLITTLLSVLDHAIHHRQPLWPARNVKGLRDLRIILDHAIFETLQEDQEFSDSQTDNLELFSILLTQLAKQRHGRHIGLITTNYDVSSDWTVLRAALPKARWGSWRPEDVAAAVDFGTDWLDPDSDSENQLTRPKRSTFSCYKLHGSTNWLRCPVCQRIYINPYGSTWFQGLRTKQDDLNTCHCSPTKLEPQIVSPSFVRQLDDLNLLNIWNQAHTLLRHAEHWVIIGYSLPEEDVAIRSLFTRALHCRESPPQVTVVQMSNDAEAKYKALFVKRNLKYIIGGLEKFMQIWHETT